LLVERADKVVDQISRDVQMRHEWLISSFDNPDSPVRYFRNVLLQDSTLVRFNGGFFV
jgi:hypothetical protein